MRKNTLLRKVLAYACCALLLVSISVAATIAYFTDSEMVTNTFTVGNVAITMDEKNIDGKDANGEENEAEERDTANKYHLIPGSTYVKDPTIHVGAESEECWLFVKVDNGLAAIEIDLETDDHKKIENQMTANGWAAILDAQGKPTGYYAYYKEKAAAGADVPVFGEFTIDGDSVTNDVLAEYADAQIVVTAYAIQGAGFDTSDAAWAAIKDQLSLQ